MERHEYEDAYREQQDIKHTMAYEAIKQDGEDQEEMLRYIFEMGELPETLEVYSDTHDDYIDFDFDDVFDADEIKIIKECMKVDELFDGEFEDFLEFVDNNINMYKRHKVSEGAKKLAHGIDKFVKDISQNGQYIKIKKDIAWVTHT